MLSNWYSLKKGIYTSFFFFFFFINPYRKYENLVVDLLDSLYDQNL